MRSSRSTWLSWCDAGRTMNFLAHCMIPDRAVAGSDPDLIAGGFLGDFVKGRVREDLPPRLAAGVRLHRRIDAYSNQHPGIRQSCQRFPPELRRVAPVLVDIVADHLLARHWQRFHPAALTDFTATAYAAIRPHVYRLPEPGRRFFRFMSEDDLLARYLHVDAMHRGVAAIMRRLNRSESSTGAMEVIDERLVDLDQDFLDYFPDLIAHAADWLARAPEVHS